MIEVYAEDEALTPREEAVCPSSATTLLAEWKNMYHAESTGQHYEVMRVLPEPVDPDGCTVAAGAQVNNETLGEGK